MARGGDRNRKLVDFCMRKRDKDGGGGMSMSSAGGGVGLGVRFAKLRGGISWGLHIGLCLSRVK